MRCVVASARLILVLCASSATPAPQTQTGQAGGTHLGTVSFPVSCSPSVQSEFNRAVALLHSFQYAAAEKSFQSVAHADLRCAMAQWGRAMSLYRQLWDWPNAETLRKGSEEARQAEKLGAKTPRERDYIAALKAFFNGDETQDYYGRAAAYSAAMEKVYEKYPQDAEAAAFYALSLLASEPPHDSTLAHRKKALAILEKLCAALPNHPGAAHYLIHAADRPEFAEQGLAAARAYAQIAPDSSHALHMPSHIFTRLGLWQDSIDSNLAAAASAEKATREHWGDPHYQIHALDFLDYAYLQVGQESEAQRVTKELSSVPGADAKDIESMRAAFQIRYAIELRQWNEAAVFQAPTDADSWAKEAVAWARTISAARAGDVAAASKTFQEFTQLALANEQHGHIMGDTETGTSVRRQEQEAWIAFAQAKKEDALKLMRAAAEKEEVNNALAFYPPAREMLADILLELGEPAEALAEFENALKFSPNRFDSLYGAARAAAAAGNTSKAAAYYSQLLKNCDSGAHSARPELADAKSFLARQTTVPSSQSAPHSPRE